MKTKSLIVFFLIIANQFMAQAPQGINYQGVARNASGLALSNQNIGLQIDILNGSSSGTSVYSETFNLTTDANGFFDLIIGTGTPVLGTFSAIDWATGNGKWLAVSMDAGGGTSYQLIGTSQLVSVPYALYAKNTALKAGNGIVISNDSIINTGSHSLIAGSGITISNDSVINMQPDKIVSIDTITGIKVSGSYPTFTLTNTKPNQVVSITAGTGIGISGTYPTFTVNNTAPTGWTINGNAGTTSGTNFIGTTDDNDVVIKRNNIQSGLINNSLFNTSWGVRALNYAATGGANTALGYFSLYSNTTGGGNTATGHEALNANTTGGFNNATGYATLQNNTIGGYNTANGGYALYSNVAGSNATAVGYGAMYFSNNKTTAFTSYNVAVGYEALYGSTIPANNTGNYNTAVGYTSLFNTTSGYDNTCIGYSSLYNVTTGFANTAAGMNSLLNNTTGGMNTAIGFQALLNNTTGLYNTATGPTALNDNTSGGHNTATGYEALFFNTIGNQNTATGYDALYNATGSNNTGMGTYSGTVITTGSNNTALGYNAQVPTATASNQVRIGDVNISYAGIQVAWTVTSDMRWKDQVRGLPYGLNMINKLRPVDYIRKNNQTKTREIGFIAQEVDSVLKVLGYKNQGMLTKDDNGYMALRYNDFIPVLVKGMQEQQSQIEELQSKLNEQLLINTSLKSENTVISNELKNTKYSFDERIKALESLLSGSAHK